MNFSLRQVQILELIRSTGRVAVEELAVRFDVTLQTIRRDLGELADAGMLDRVHGGAVLRGGALNIGYDERRQTAAEAKAAIGAACAALIADNTSLIVNLGTTTEAVARALTQHRNLTVITNNMNVANILAPNETCEVIVSGGTLRRSDGGLVGDLTSDFMGRFKVDCAIIGTSALDDDGDLLDFDMAEVRVSQAILRQARRAVLVADHSKLQRRAPMRIASLADLDLVVTDRALPAPLTERCRTWGTEVVVAGAV
ncbi:DeoR/GlpR transcriptional regulator [Paracoccus suum]|uniref:DeoR/GlpR transcriptional regulator n=1 Tax=Paracoccus suum TaxID=2259340 RepID=A0A344PG38_9RHOB|nr:DeoR/GlpR family DNA-binding transcription regulator [Paracoccus suum]AXC48343.1 DeoR/GlpR transcriptional regulator [Paracoccus suum]